MAKMAPMAEIPIRVNDAVNIYCIPKIYRPSNMVENKQVKNFGSKFFLVGIDLECTLQIL